MSLPSSKRRKLDDAAPSATAAAARSARRLSQYRSFVRLLGSWWDHTTTRAAHTDLLPKEPLEVSEFRPYTNTSIHVLSTDVMSHIMGFLLLEDIQKCSRISTAFLKHVDTGLHRLALIKVRNDRTLELVAKQCRNVRKLELWSLKDWHLGSNAREILVDVFQNCTRLQSINFVPEDVLGRLDTQHQLPHLDDLRIQTNDSDLRVLARNCGNLHSVTIFNYCSDDTADTNAHLRELIHRNTQLTELFLDRFVLDHDLLSQLRFLPNLTSLDLERAQLTNQHCRVICEVVPGLQELGLTDNQSIDITGIAHVARNLRELQWLDIHGLKLETWELRELLERPGVLLKLKKLYVSDLLAGSCREAFKKRKIECEVKTWL